MDNLEKFEDKFNNFIGRYKDLHPSNMVSKMSARSEK